MEDKWREKLTPEHFDKLSALQYRVMREKGTEPAFSGKYFDSHEKGMYKCAACGLELFSSDTKFDSGTGWPSFTEPFGSEDPSGSERPANLENVELKEDNSHGPPSPSGFGGASMRRTEVLCKRCGSHLGHVFDDGPPAGGGKRYCINSVCLDLERKDEHREV